MGFSVSVYCLVSYQLWRSTLLPSALPYFTIIGFNMLVVLAFCLVFGRKDLCEAKPKVRCSKFCSKSATLPRVCFKPPSPTPTKVYWVKWTMLQWTQKERAVTRERPCRYKSTNLTRQCGLWYLRPKFLLEFCLKQLILDVRPHKDWPVSVRAHKDWPVLVRAHKDCPVLVRSIFFLLRLKSSKNSKWRISHNIKFEIKCPLSVDK